MEDFKPLLKNNKFLYLWTSQILSQITIYVMNFILLIRIFNHTGSTIATSLLWVSYALPSMLVGPFAAAAVDMLDKRKILMLTNLFQSLVIFVYALTYERSFFLLYGMAFTYALLNQLYVPAELASLPALVARKNLPHSNGLFFLTQTAAMIVGFGVAGILQQIIGFESSLFLSAGFLFVAFISVSFLPKLSSKDSIPKKYEEVLAKFFKRILEGYFFIKKHKSVLYPFLLLIGLQISITVLVINMPLVASEILKVSVNSSGIFVVLPIGIGTAIGALAVPRLLKVGWRKKRAIEVFLMLIAPAIFLLAFFIPSLRLFNRIFIGEVLLVIVGLSFVGILIPTQTFLQEVTPGGLRGRVFGNYWFLVTIATILPVLLAGAITELFGIRFLLLILVGVAISILVYSKRFGQNLIENGF